MRVTLTNEVLDALRSRGVSTHHQPGRGSLPEDVRLEPPCSLKWMGVDHSLRMGAFSYAVSGFYFACEIGRYCSFGENVQIGRHPHPLHWASTSPYFYQDFSVILDQPLPPDVDPSYRSTFKATTPPTQLKKTIIENDVWIGHGAFILPGVRIGTGAAVAAQAVVTKDVAPYAVVGGSPARVLRFRFNDVEIAALLDSRWWEFAPWQLAGAPVDRPTAFAQFVQGLRDQGMQPYRPAWCDLRSLDT